MDIKIVYIYLNMDTKRYVADRQGLADQIGDGVNVKAIPSPGHARVLIAGGKQPFSFSDATRVDQELSA